MLLLVICGTIAIDYLWHDLRLGICGTIVIGYLWPDCCSLFVAQLSSHPASKQASKQISQIKMRSKTWTKMKLRCDAEKSWSVRDKSELGDEDKLSRPK